MHADTRAFISRWWNSAWSEGLWAAAWSKSLDGLTPEQAAWQPPSAPGVAGTRHSIWQLVLHMCLWREHWLRKLRGEKTPPEDLKRLNFPEIKDISERAWADARRRFEDTQARVREVLADPSTSGEHAEGISHFLPHDAYHFGQISYIRAMLGMKPLE